MRALLERLSEAYSNRMVGRYSMVLCHAARAEAVWGGMCTMNERVVLLRSNLLYGYSTQESKHVQYACVPLRTNSHDESDDRLCCCSASSRP